MDVIDFIPYGPEHPVTRQELMRLTGLSDRKVRRDIEFARMMYPIINVSDGRGYYIATSSNDPEVKRYWKQELSRIKSISKSLTATRKLLTPPKQEKQIKGQMSLFEVIT